MSNNATKLPRLAIDPANITQEMIELPAQLAIAGMSYASAVAATIKAKAERDAVRARVSLNLRNDASTAGRKLTEANLDDMVVVSADYRSAVEAYAGAEYNEAHARGILDALKSKRDMLLMLGARMRDEREPRTVSNEHQHEDHWRNAGEPR